MGTARYLTAQKISLLVLLRLYYSSTLPSSATIPILSFILSTTLPSTSSSVRSLHSSATSNPSFSIDSFEDVLQGHASNMPGRTLLDLFLKSMWEMNSFDALHALFHNLGELLMTPSHQEGEGQERIYLSKPLP